MFRRVLFWLRINSDTVSGKENKNGYKLKEIVTDYAILTSFYFLS